jgi:prevent-host-death family protein
MTKISNIADAKSQLSALVAAAERGEEVILARKGKPIVRLVPVDQVDDRAPGMAAGILDGWTEAHHRALEAPLTDEELTIFAGGDLSPPLRLAAGMAEGASAYKPRRKPGKP